MYIVFYLKKYQMDFFGEILNTSENNFLHLELMCVSNTMVCTSMLFLSENIIIYKNISYFKIQ